MLGENSNFDGVVVKQLVPKGAADRTGKVWTRHLLGHDAVKCDVFVIETLHWQGLDPPVFST